MIGSREFHIIWWKFKRRKTGESKLDQIDLSEINKGSKG
jgi:hypothetical protein